MNELNPLGHASPDRYQMGEWPLALLQRMEYLVRRTHKDGVLLDIGCGEGALLDSAGLKGFGVDLNSDRLALAIDRKLAVALANGTELPFIDNSFHTVVSMEVLEHVPDMELMMREVNRILEPGGYWVVSVPSVTLRSRYEMWREKRPYYCDGDEHYREFSESRIKGFDHRFMRVSDFVAMFESCGFFLTERDGVRYLFPQWFARFPLLQKWLESPKRDRLWSGTPWIRNFPYWTILLFRRKEP